MQTLKKFFGARLQENIPLKNFTTVKIGGPAKAFIETKTEQELKLIIQLAQEKNIPFLVIGGGSNLLVSDTGIDCLVIKNAVSGIEKSADELIVKSGTFLQAVVNFSINQGLGGMQKLTGVPGTVGGAIYGNAGAYGQAVSDHLIKVVCLDPKNQTLITLTKDQCLFTYRHSDFTTNNLIILETHFKLEPGDKQILIQEAKKIISERMAGYSWDLKCPGSFFKNVLVTTVPADKLNLIPQEKIINNKVPVGFLLESVGVKGQKQGHIQISPKHANLFINLGEGKATDFYSLVKLCAQKVKEKYGITLEPEVQLINLPPLT